MIQGVHSLHLSGEGLLFSGSLLLSVPSCWFFCLLSASLMTDAANATSLTLHGLRQLSDQRLLFFILFLAAYVFALCSDGLVLVVICTHRGLHRPMYAFVGALLLNSLVGGSALYPRLLWELLWEGDSVIVTLPACACQAWVLYTLGTSAFMLLAAMAFDRYVAICQPMRYAALVSPRVVGALLLFCWLIPAAMIGGTVLLAARLPHCRAQVDRLYCDLYSLIRISCGGGGAQLSEVLALLSFTATVLVPAAFVLFTYSSILFVCVCRTRSFSGKALRTCLPHLLVFLNYSGCSAAELLQRRLQAADQPATSVLTSVLVVLVPTVLNPVVYGLNMSAITDKVRRLLGSRKTD
ncbi:olfactory receptor 10J5 [Fundulus heteroclitus]|uniref:olfactory receptor 10J5 n=1 Tax=Fundulus heteroclitus TaxID=8078 RepID=UPI00165BA780|nr:olfactory receptor 10J5 [Fundulus heteroclitus]